MSQLTLTQMGWLNKTNSIKLKQKEPNKTTEEPKTKKQNQKKQQKFLYNFLKQDYSHQTLKETIDEYGLKFTIDMQRFYIWKREEITDNHIKLIKKLYVVLKKKAINTNTKIISIHELLQHTIFVSCPSFSKKVAKIIEHLRKYQKSNTSNVLLKIKRHHCHEKIYSYLRVYYCWLQKQCDVFVCNETCFLFVFLKTK